jgi:hypothetical protein
MILVHDGPFFKYLSIIFIISSYVIKFKNYNLDIHHIFSLYSSIMEEGKSKLGDALPYILLADSIGYDLINGWLD